MMQRFSRLIPTLVLAAFAFTSLTPANAAALPAKPFLGVAMEKKDDQGVIIRDVTPDSPAAQAGLKNGDVVKKIGDEEVKTPEGVVEMVGTHKPGDKLTLHILRDGKDEKLDVVLGERKAPRLLPMPEKSGKKRATFLGVWSGAPNDELKKQLGVNVDKGAVVMAVMPDSPAAKAGLKKDDLITHVDDKAIANPEALRSAISAMEPGKEATLKIIRGGKSEAVKVQLLAGPFGFGMEHEFPLLQDGKFPFEKFPGMDKGIEKLFEEMKKRFQEMEKNRTPDRSL